MPHIDRRTLVAALATTPLAAGLGGRANAQASGEVALANPGPLPEKGFGPEDARVKVIEYASITCHHCQNFHANTWPQVKAKYVDTGKIRFVMREFPLNPLAAGGFMLARCVPDDRWYPAIDVLYRTAETWSHAQDPVAELQKVMRQLGMGKEAFEACLSNQKLLDDINAVGRSGSMAGVTGTPTFFFNGGQKRQGALTLAEFSAIVDPMLS
ncbi:disulfide bond formation protein DsbD [Methylopila jiangsuensis]|uniref:Disulfide bond formation protein DsbD n=1 Tax=Methylopila jiangsuensis TaxID=586230 RepID=A0A9W6JI83_9HYPH|nr:thioredoxin domain-containing protein [Methylopila jiangsuensis]MDR6284492.1 protein-disulfide isomerase [Methylopila jiangsuensis]GLK78120.1 disulfide bond formation protein DsbD [Methylopila jiangsuensis]